MKRAFLVLGAQRSGASVSSHLLSKFGVDFGDATKDIWEGFRAELKWINDFNNLIIEALGYQYTDFFLPLEQDFKGIGTHKIEPFIQKLIDVEWPEQKIVGLRDPRFSLTFPVWEQVLRQKGYQLNVVHVFRRPANVLNSNRRFFQHGEGWVDMKYLNFWLQLNLAAVYFTRNYPVHYIEYDDLMLSPLETAQQLADCFRLTPESIQTAASVIGLQQGYHQSPLETGYPFVDRCYDLLSTRSLTPDYYLRFRSTFLPVSVQSSVAV